MHTRRSALKLVASLAATLPVASSVHRHQVIVRPRKRFPKVPKIVGEHPPDHGWCDVCGEMVDCRSDDFVRMVLTRQGRGRESGSSVGNVHVIHRDCWSLAAESVVSYSFPRH